MDSGRIYLDSGLSVSERLSFDYIYTEDEETYIHIVCDDAFRDGFLR